MGGDDKGFLNSLKNNVFAVFTEFIIVLATPYVAGQSVK